MALYVWFTSTILVGIKQDKKDSMTLVMVDCGTLLMDPNVESTMDPKGVVLYGELTPKVKYVPKFM